MARIFISYRRQDSGGWVRHLIDHLRQHFKPQELFMDIDTIEPGVDFVKVVTDAVSSCDILLAVIGPNWLTASDPHGCRRLDNPEDFIRLEISAALSRDIRVIPVLVGGIEMPSAEDLPDDIKALTRRQAHELTDNRWDYDSGQLVEILKRTLKHPETTAHPTFGAKRASTEKIGYAGIASLLSALLAILFLPALRPFALIFAAAAILFGIRGIAKSRIEGKKPLLPGIAIAASSLVLLLGGALMLGPMIPSRPSPEPPSPDVQVPQPAPEPQRAAPPEPPQPTVSEPPRPVIPQPSPPTIAPTPQPLPAADLSGDWYTLIGEHFRIAQHGGQLDFEGETTGITFRGAGRIEGKLVTIPYELRSTATGEFKAKGVLNLTVSSNAMKLSGSYYIETTGRSGEFEIIRRRR
jgi:hypothetical protein